MQKVHPLVILHKIENAESAEQMAHAAAQWIAGMIGSSLRDGGQVVGVQTFSFLPSDVEGEGYVIAVFAVARETIEIPRGAVVPFPPGRS